MKRQKGITLVALVITIVIIVILSSVTLVATFGDNGIIKKAELARDLASNSTLKEAEDMNILMDEYANIMSGGENPVPGPEEDKTPPTVEIVVGEVTETSIAITANAIDDSGEVSSYKYYLNDELKDTLSTNTYKYDGLTAGTEYTIKVEAFDKANNKGEKTITASTKESPNSVKNRLKEGDYVNYVDVKGKTRKCVVLYDNTSGYGIQIITMDTVEDVTLGSSNFTTSMDSYNSAIRTLNSKAEEYNNNTYSSDARCVGSVPNDKNSESGMYKTQFGGDYDGKLRDTDNNYEIDYNKMQARNIHYIGKVTYWLASRTVPSLYDDANFSLRFISSGYLSQNNLCQVYSDGSLFAHSYSCGLRPVFILKSGIKVTGGDGSEASPYELGV